MNRYFAASLAAAALVIVPRSAGAQSVFLKLPDLSQHARLTQRIGLTDITIDYNRPLARGRKIFGGLQPYGEVWRAGANFNTTIEFSDAVTVQGSRFRKVFTDCTSFRAHPPGSRFFRGPRRRGAASRTTRRKMRFA